MDKLLFFILAISLATASCQQNNQNKDNADTETPSDMSITSGEGAVQQVIERTNIPKVSIAEAKRLAEEEGYRFVDLRTPEETAKGKIPDALEINIRSATFFEDKIEQLNKDDKLILYCRSGRRSDTAAKLFSELQFTNVVDMTDGYIEWVKYEDNKN